jgi:hypothetical protein
MAALVVAVVLVAGGCSGGADSGQLCDHLVAVRSISSLGQGAVDVAAFKEVRRELAKVKQPAALRGDVDALIGLLDLVIDRFGDIDLANPSGADLAKLQVAQQELETKVFAADASLQRVRAAADACAAATSTTG